MPSLQNFLSTATPQAAKELFEAFKRVPEGKRSWAPNDKIRSAVDLVAECAVLNGYTADMIPTRKFWTDNLDKYPKEKAAASALSLEELSALLDANTQKVVAALSALSDEDLDIQVDMPWGKMTLAQIITYPYWNMTYHQGQLNLIQMWMDDAGLCDLWEKK